MPLTDPQFEVDLEAVEIYGGRPGTERSSLVYIHRSRILRGTGREHDLRDQYLRDLSVHIERFAALLDGLRPAALVGAPSSSTQIMPFLTRARDMFPDRIDLTYHFRKDASAGEASDFSQFLTHLTYSGPCLNEIPGSVLIVDDSFAKGMTVGAIAKRMVDAGLPTSAPIIVRVPLRLTKE